MNLAKPIAILLATMLISSASAEEPRIGDAWHDTRNPIVRIFAGERLDLWSLQKVQQVAVPEVSETSLTITPIDRFLIDKLPQGQSLSPAADRRTLARRLYFDLTGLPPSPERIEHFLTDERPAAYERLVDGLLASPGYGEHSARLWLDVVRYSDSNGFDWDEFRPQAWRFRDYVIRSFNADKPFDQFIREQLAGDELLAGPPCNPAEQDLLIATTFLRLGPQDNSSALFNEEARSRAELLADLVETTSSAFLGLTMSCCRCHDHKYDPISQADHFRLRAFFEPVKYADDVPLNFAAEQQAIETHNSAVDAKVAIVEQQREALKQTIRARLNADTTDEQISAAYSAEEKQRDATWQEDISKIEKQRRSFEFGLLMTDAAEETAATHILYQGDYKSPREAVSPGFLSALDPNPAEIAPPPNKQTKGRRLTLAHWIVAPENPLTARVLVNRIWQQHFGRGLVATPNDFGLGGSRPTHPELLDYLAGELVRSGWSVKQLHRAMVTSAAYRQSSLRSAGKADAENKLVARQTLRRLTAEQLRDSLLTVSGLLVPRTGGSPVWPELPPEVLQANPAFLDDNATRTKGWYPSPPPLQNVRTVFLVQKRTVRVPFLETFDLPENSTSCARRTTSTVAPQAFSLLNSPLAIEAGTAFAERVQRSASQPTEQVEQIFLLALQRKPEPDESAACVALLRDRGLTELCRVMLNLNEFVYVD